MAVVVAADGVGLMGVVILLERIDGGGFVGSFANILAVCVLTWSPGEEGRLLDVRTVESSSSCPPS